MLATKKTEFFTYQDYLKWPDDERWEIIEGKAFYLGPPAPILEHQSVAGDFFGILREKLKGQKCTPFISPVDVVFSDTNVVQPDVVVVCDPSKLQKTHIHGAPDIVIEVLSPSTALKDKREKKVLFEKYGVKEYIIVHPGDSFVEYYQLKNGQFLPPLILGPESELVFHALNVSIPLKEIFKSASKQRYSLPKPSHLKLAEKRKPLKKLKK